MERVIKFRGKGVLDGEWHYGYLHIYETDNHFYTNKPCKKAWILSPMYPDSVSWSINDTFRPYEVIPKTVGQFTGLKDKNGKEIYCDDIYDAHGFKYKVMFVGGAFVGGINENSCAPLGWTTKHNDDDSDMLLSDFCSCNVEVIGNIHSNPELL